MRARFYTRIFIHAIVGLRIIGYSSNFLFLIFFIIQGGEGTRVFLYVFLG